MKEAQDDDERPSSWDRKIWHGVREETYRRRGWALGLIGGGLGYVFGSLLLLALGRGDTHLLVMGLLALTAGLLVPRKRSCSLLTTTDG